LDFLAATKYLTLNNISNEVNYAVVGQKSLSHGQFGNFPKRDIFQYSYPTSSKSKSKSLPLSTMAKKEVGENTAGCLLSRHPLAHVFFC
jgi:hypothetical protein